MNSKEIIKKLIKIAEKQQKILTKMAQQDPRWPTQEQAPGKLEPGKAELSPARKVLDALAKEAPQTRAAMLNLELHGNTMYVVWKPNQGTDQHFNKVLEVMGKVLPPGKYDLKEKA